MKLEGKLCLNLQLVFYLSHPTPLPPGVSLGQSTEIRTIWALEIAGGLEIPQAAEPKILFVAGVHGNAAVGPELLLEFASVLCLNYGRNPAITKASFTKPLNKPITSSFSYLLCTSVCKIMESFSGEPKTFERECNTLVRMQKFCSQIQSMLACC